MDVFFQIQFHLLRMKTQLFQHHLLKLLSFLLGEPIHHWLLALSSGMPRMKDLYVAHFAGLCLPHAKLRNDLTLSRQRAARVPLTFPFSYLSYFKEYILISMGLFFLVISN